MDKEKIANIAMSKEIKTIKELNELIRQYESLGIEIKNIFEQIKNNKIEINNEREFDLLDNQVEYVNNNLKNLEFKLIKKLSCSCCGTETPIEGLIETKEKGLVCLMCLQETSRDEYYDKYKQELIFKKEKTQPALKTQPLLGGGWGNIGGNFNGHLNPHLQNKPLKHSQGFQEPKSYMPKYEFDEDISID